MDGPPRPHGSNENPYESSSLTLLRTAFQRVSFARHSMSVECDPALTSGGDTAVPTTSRPAGSGQRGSSVSSASRHEPLPAQLAVADSHECITVFFSDLVGFSSWASNLPPAKVMATLNDLYSRLDDIITYKMPSLYKASKSWPRWSSHEMIFNGSKYLSFPWSTPSFHT